jgi:hypothetical protein
MLHRSPREKLLAWIVTGPPGHLYGTVADITVLWVRWGRERVRRRIAGSG